MNTSAADVVSKVPEGVIKQRSGERFTGVTKGRDYSNMDVQREGMNSLTGVQWENNSV